MESRNGHAMFLGNGNDLGGVGPGQQQAVTPIKTQQPAQRMRQQPGSAVSLVPSYCNVSCHLQLNTLLLPHVFTAHDAHTRAPFV